MYIHIRAYIYIYIVAYIYIYRDVNLDTDICCRYGCFYKSRVHTDIYTDKDMELDTNIDIDMAASVNWGPLKGSRRAPVKGLGIDTYHFGFTVGILIFVNSWVGIC